MKIIKQSEIWKIEMKCIGNKNKEDGCEAVLEVEAVDIYLSYQQANHNRDVDYAYTFKCPCCGKETMIDEKDIPLNVRRAILSIEQANGTRLKYLRKLGYR